MMVELPSSGQVRRRGESMREAPQSRRETDRLLSESEITRQIERGYKMRPKAIPSFTLWTMDPAG